MTYPDRICAYCPHPMDPHVLVALYSAELADVPDVPAAGVLFCPECGCTVTWSADGTAAPELPPAEQLAEIRNAVFGV